MRPLPFAFFALVAVGGSPSGAAAWQCPDGTPPPCAATRRPAAPRRAPPSPTQRGRQYMLLPFRNVTRADAQEWLVTGAPLMLADALGQLRELNVVRDEQLLAARRRLGIAPDAVLEPDQLRRVAEETGGWTAVSGNIVATGGRLRISAQAVDAVSARVVARGEVDVAADADVRPAFDRLSAQLLQAGGLPPATAGLASMTTRSLDAYQAYVRGMALLQQSAYMRARDSFQRAVQLDSTFALAWMRLALTRFWNIQAMMDPRSGAYTAAERAAALSSQLPLRQARLIRALASFFRGQAVSARAIVDTLLATDPEDLDARELGALFELGDFVIDTTRGPPTLRGNLNRAIRMARGVLERDPGRRSNYATLTWVYAMGGGLWFGGFPGTRREGISFAAMMSGATETFVPVVRDSIELMSERNFTALPAAEQRRLRRLAADAGAAWMQHWLAAGPADADAHLWASRFLEIQDSFPQASREAAVAESLGVEDGFERIRGRRVMLLMRAGRFAEAGVLADSLAGIGALDRRDFATVVDNSRSFGLAALLISGRLSRAGVVARSAARIHNVRPACRTLTELPVYGFRGSLPDSVAAAIADTLAAHASDIAADSVLTLCLSSYQGFVGNRGRTRAAERMAALAESLVAAGRTDAAVLAARGAWLADSAISPRLARLEPVVTRQRQVEWTQRLRPLPLVVTGDSVVASWELLGAEPLVWHAPGLPLNLSADISIGNDTVEPREETFYIDFWITWRERPAALQGTISALMPDLEAQLYSSRRTPPVLGTRVTRAEAGGRLVVTVHGGLADELRRRRPAAAKARGSCSPWSAEPGRCSPVTVPIEYRAAGAAVSP